MKIQDLATNDSSFIELDLNEAADVCGGFDSYLFGDMNPNDFSTYAAQGGARMAQMQVNNSPFYQEFLASGFDSVSDYALYRMNRRSVRR